MNGSVLPAQGQHSVAVEVHGNRWSTTWPRLLAVVTVVAVAAPAFIASYHHAVSVAERAGETVMAAWLPLSVDGLLLAALVVIWVRRWTCQAVGKWPWFAFWLGMAATTAANLAAAKPYLTAYLVAIWPPCAVAVTLELVALVVTPVYKRFAKPVLQPSGREIEAMEDASGVPVVCEVVDLTTALYQLFNADGELIYVGISCDVTSRLATHRRSKDWWSEVVRTVVRNYESRAQALAVEEHIIQSAAPRYNIAKGRLIDPHSLKLGAGQTEPQTDDDLLNHIREWISEEAGAVPSRERIRTRYGIGTGRADRLRTAVMDGSDQESNSAPVNGKVVNGTS